MTSRREFISNTFGIARNGLDLANPSRPSPFNAAAIRYQYLQSRTNDSKNIAELGRFLGGQHTCHHERFTSRGNAASVAADFVNAYFWGARRCPGRHPHHRRAGASTGELGLLRAERI